MLVYDYNLSFRNCQELFLENFVIVLWCEEGNIKLKAKYDYIFNYNNGLNLAILDGEYSYINLEGQEIFRAKNSCEKGMNKEC